MLTLIINRLYLDRSCKQSNAEMKVSYSESKKHASSCMFFYAVLFYIMGLMAGHLRVTSIFLTGLSSLSSTPPFLRMKAQTGAKTERRMV